MVEALTLPVSPALAHIIERPRLIARLEEGGGSRVSVFAAPAGYGKTTLARQWSERQSGPVVWYRTTRASGDIALLAVQLDELLASVAPELPRDPRKVGSIASVNPSPKPLGRALVRTFETLTRDILLIVDEWEAAVTPESDELLSMLVDGLGIRFVITTRERPEWFVPRLQVYGEGLEIGVDELTMTDDEAAQVLATSGAVSGRARLMRTAEGWPAVLGLAAMSGEVDFTSDKLISRKLYDFLASELLASARPETQEAMILLAVAAVGDIDRARHLLGAGADAALEDATARGLIAVPDGKSLFLHPLLKELLLRRFAEADEETRARMLTQWRRLFEKRLWDEALSVAEISRDAEFIEAAIEVGLNDLLAAGRTSSLERWVGAARVADVAGGLTDYAEAELRLRKGEFDRGLALGARAARALNADLAARSHLVAARSAHLGSRAAARDSHLDHAGALVATLQTEADLRWLRFAASVEDERPDAEALCERLEELEAKTVDHELRIANAHIQLGLMRGSLRERLDAAEPVVTLIDQASDPYAISSVLNICATALTVRGRYGEALAMADRELTIADEYDLSFVVAFGQINRVRALTGLRRFGEARRALAVVQKQIRDTDNPYLECQRVTYAAALEISQGDPSRAVDVLGGELNPRAGTSMVAERRAMHALALTALGQEEAATEQADEARSLARNVETVGLLAATSAVRGAQANDSAQVLRACNELLELGTGDALILAWRACVEVARILLGSRRHREAVMPLLLEANDTSIAKTIGIPVPRDAQRRRGLSPREREVCELLAQGLTNDEIARVLFISLSTTKVHVKHIFEKLGARSRIEAARLWESEAT